MEDSLAAEELDVDHHGEVHVQDDVVVDGEAKQKPDQPELLLSLKGGRVEPVQPRRLIVCVKPCSIMVYSTVHMVHVSNVQCNTVW